MICNHCWEAFVSKLPFSDYGANDVFVRCRRCEVVRTVSMDPPFCVDYDGQGYWQQGNGSEFFVDGIPQNKRYMGSRLPPLLHAGCDKPWGNKRLLQVGPGQGQMTPHLLSWGWSVHCCEIGKWSASYLENAYPPVTVYCENWETLDTSTEFEVIMANHSLEHFLRADTALEKMCQSIVPGGKVYIEVPAVLLDDGSVNYRAWPQGVHNHDHWWHFSERSLRTWFEALGMLDICFLNTVREHENSKLMDYHVVAVKP